MSALNEIQKVQQRDTAQNYGGKQAGQFVNETKGATLHQLNPSGVTGSIPGMLSLMVSCLMVAADSKAEEQRMNGEGYKHLSQGSHSTLRSCSIDVHQDGARKSFAKAGSDFDFLQNMSAREIPEKITRIHQLMPSLDRSPYAVEDLTNTLEDLANQSRRCTNTASETRENFAKWGQMIGELQLLSEAQYEAADLKQDSLAALEKNFASRRTEVEERVRSVAQQIEIAQKCLDAATDKVPSAWGSVASDAANGMMQAIPSIIAGAIFGIIAGPSTQSQANDPAYAAAIATRDVTATFYEYLGGEKESLDSQKFEESGVQYILRVFRRQKELLAPSDSDANKQVLTAFGKIIQIAGEMEERQGKKELAADKLPSEVISQWKSGAKEARDTLLQVATAGIAMASANPMNVFMRSEPGNADSRTQTSQVNNAVAKVQIAHEAAELSLATYEAAVGETATVSSGFEKKLQGFQETGASPNDLPTILQNGTSIIAEFSRQMGKVEQFYATLEAIVQTILLRQANDLRKQQDEGGRREPGSTPFSAADVSKQVIYTITLQLKAYYSLLGDVAAMYVEASHRMMPVIDVSEQFSRSLGSRRGEPGMDRQLSSVIQDSGRMVKELVSRKQGDTFRDLRERAERAAELMKRVEEIATGNGIAVDASAKKAIEQGAAMSIASFKATLAH